MLQITIPKAELYDEANGFIDVEETDLQLEHSLISLSKWESKWCKPFLVKGEKTDEETVDYIRCMTLTKNVNPNVYLALTPENIKQILDYIEHPMSATTVADDGNSKGRKQIVTSELIYSWMIDMGIPCEFDRWHINRLMMLIKVRSAEANKSNKKKPTKQTALDYATLNAERKKKRQNMKG